MSHVTIFGGPISLSLRHVKFKKWPSILGVNCHPPPGRIKHGTRYNLGPPQPAAAPQRWWHLREPRAVTQYGVGRAILSGVFTAHVSPDQGTLEGRCRDAVTTLEGRCVETTEPPGGDGRRDQSGGQKADENNLRHLIVQRN